MLAEDESGATTTGDGEDGGREEGGDPTHARSSLRVWSATLSKN
jgi:hypothetical protein